MNENGNGREEMNLRGWCAPVSCDTDLQSALVNSGSQ